MEVIAIIWFVGLWVSLAVFARRVGLRLFGDSLLASVFAHAPSRRNGIPWLFVAIGKAVVWPVVIVFWLVNDRPASTVLYGQAAADRLGFGDRELQYHERGFASKWTADPA